MRRIVIGLAVLLIAAGIAASRLTGLGGPSFGGGEVRDRPAPEFAEIDAWVNTDPLTIRSLRGKVVLIDFWTYTCINCVRTFGHLRALYARYAPFGLQIVGVHSPEFAFEKELANVREAVARHRLPYPVALDNRMATWREYRNHYWPHVYLIDAKGIIRDDVIGEGGEERIQSTVRALLREAGATLPAEIALDDTGPSAHITPEIYAGFERGSAQGSLANDEGYRADEVASYRAPTQAQIDEAGTGGAFFLAGRWRAAEEYVEAAEDGARIVVPFFARDVFLVGESAAGARVEVLLDGVAVAAARAGVDVRDGVLTVGRSDMFAVARFPRPERHVLELRAPAGFRLYTFTFG